ncbi:MAG: tripartite tricarboxylate transporter TctB family protein [Holosporales bacterium]|jgi:hypothetical protein|nr:tripartite tricarboxylate transporter TctB family protein [Holosporales bacterium]
MLKLVWEIAPLLLMILSYGIRAVGLFSVRTFDPVGAAKYPLFLTLTVAILSIPIAIDSIRKMEKIETSEVREPVRRIVLIIGFTAIYLCVLQTVGFVISTPVYISALLLSLGTRKTSAVLLVSLGATIALYVMFVCFFGVLLPEGLLGAFFQ